MICLSERGLGWLVAIAVEGSKLARKSAIIIGAYRIKGISLSGPKEGLSLTIESGED